MFVYLAAFVAAKGATIDQMLGGQFLPWMKAEVGSTTKATLEEGAVKKAFANQPLGRLLPCLDS
jgi:hypothetical protein